MKQSILLLLVCLSLNCYSQFYLGINEEQFRKRFKQPALSKIYKNSNNDFPFITFEFNSRCVGILYFKDKAFKKSFSLKQVPNYEWDFKKMVEEYNQIYVIISANSWRCYSKEGVFSIIAYFDSQFNRNMFYIEATD